MKQAFFAAALLMCAPPALFSAAVDANRSEALPADLSMDAGMSLEADAASFPAQVIIIRHAEKPEIGNDLSPRGQERAQALVGFFHTNPAVTQHGTPAAIYAMKPKQDGSEIRPLETVKPLAKSLKLNVNTTYQKGDAAGLAKAVLSNPGAAGKTVLIAWEHHMIPVIAKALGLDQAPKSWPDDAFDRAWIINFDGGKPVSFQNVPQHLLPGDSEK